MSLRHKSRKVVYKIYVGYTSEPYIRNTADEAVAIYDAWKDVKSYVNDKVKLPVSIVREITIIETVRMNSK